MALRKNSTPLKKKDKYRTRNWKEYNRSLVNRGSITFWFSEDAIANWYSNERGSPGDLILTPITPFDNAALQKG